jgi:hypothetical protein
MGLAFDAGVEGGNLMLKFGSVPVGLRQILFGLLDLPQDLGEFALEG